MTTSNKNNSVKNYQTFENIKRMYKKAFGEEPCNMQATILNGGLKNAVYLILEKNRKFVLKIAPKDESKMITADKNIIWWEANMLKKMEEIDFPAPRLIYYDKSCTVCESPYIFMTFIDGKNYLEIKNTISVDSKSKIEYQLGILSRKICSITKDSFFLPSSPEKKFYSNYAFVSYLFHLLIEDAHKANIELSNDTYKTISDIIDENEKSLNNILNLCLCHTDIWDGNILVEDSKITGIVDFSDLYFCDELMTFYFHTIDGKISNNFLAGFQKINLNRDEKIRIEIYRMYVILKMIVDCGLKQYGKFSWMYENLDNRIKILKAASPSCVYYRRNRDGSAINSLRPRGQRLKNNFKLMTNYTKYYVVTNPSGAKISFT